MKQAAVVLIVKDGLILSISRKTNKEKFGLPGGKVENGEMPFQAAQRETKEETSIVVRDLSKIFVREELPFEPGGETFESYCYYALSWSGEPIELEGTVIKWLTASELIGDAGAFPEYNRKSIEQLKIKFPQVMLK